jgi:hypothetical protein
MFGCVAIPVFHDFLTMQAILGYTLTAQTCSLKSYNWNSISSVAHILVAFT